MWFSFFITWEQRKLKQVATIQKGEQLSKAKLDSVGKYYVLNGGMEPSGFCDEYNTEPNTISISEGGNSCGYVALNLDRFWSGGHNYTLQNLRIDTEFLFQCLKGIEMKIMALRVGSGLPNIQKAAIDGVDIIFPLEDEQKSIGQFLTKLSNLITLHQRKQNGLFLLILGKKSSLILANDWEQRKLGELGKSQSGIGFPDKEQGGKKGIPFFKVSDMNNLGNELEMHIANNYVSLEQIKKNGWSPIEETSVIFAKVGAAIMLNRKRLVRFPFLLDNNTMAYKFNDAWEIDFGRTLFERIDLTSLVQVGALPSYNAGDVENMEVAIPQKAEQAKLGALFTSLDNLITLHQRQVEKLKNIKSALLEKMFV